MLTGQKPYTGGTAMEVLQQHVSCAAADSCRMICSRYQPFLARLLAKARGERFADAPPRSSRGRGAA